MLVYSRKPLAIALAVTSFALAGVAGVAFADRTPAPAPTAVSATNHMTNTFRGAKVNGGTVSHRHNAQGQNVLMLSNDFQIPDTPAPHWQVIDSRGNVYLLQRLKIKGDKFNQTIVVPVYVPDVAKVQIWCAWAEVLLGEASFEQAVK
jgi:hypothetical protein